MRFYLALRMTGLSLAWKTCTYIAGNLIYSESLHVARRKKFGATGVTEITRFLRFQDCLLVALLFCSSKSVNFASCGKFFMFLSLCYGGGLFFYIFYSIFFSWTLFCDKPHVSFQLWCTVSMYFLFFRFTLVKFLCHFLFLFLS